MEPIPVLRITFVDERQTGLGVSGSSVSSVLENSNLRKHRIAYHPWLRAFWVELLDKPSGTVVDAAYIPEGRVQSWRPAVAPVASAAEAAPAIDRPRK